MRSIIPTAIGAVMLALCVPLFIANIPHTDEAVELAVFDKAAPIMEAAYEAEPEEAYELYESGETRRVYDGRDW